jgi:uncharacterized protein (DUF2267 family)
MEPQFENLAPEEIAFFKKVAAELNSPDDLHRAFRVLQSVFRVLRDSLSIETSNALADQLPDAIRRIYTEGWDTTKERSSYDRNVDFYNSIRDSSSDPATDFPDNTEAKQAVQAVFKVIKEPSTASVFESVRSELPGSVKDNV